jgi:hypothetical protein
MILTIDVGLKNLAMCVMCSNDTKDVSTYDIKLWDVYNTLEEDDHKCNGLTKKGIVCGKNTCMKYQDGGSTLYTCKTHFPKDIQPTFRNKHRTKTVKEYLLQDIASSVIKKLDELTKQHEELFRQVTKVMIELQPKVNNKMKLISHIIYGTFVAFYMDTKTCVRFVRASQKLKAYKGPAIVCNLKDAYSRRKYLSIQYTIWFLQTIFENENSSGWLEMFNSHTKQDDLGDVFLMAINALKQS